MEVYRGNRRACDYCRAPFKKGQVITVDEEKGLVFCYSDAEGGCVISYMFAYEPDEAIIGRSMVYK